MKYLLLTALLLSPTISANEAFEIHVKCINGYLYVIARDENGIDIEQMTKPSKKGMVKTPLPIPCKD